MGNSKDSLIGQVIADRYQVLSLLGEGGMGRVYLAEHIRMGRKSAVKVMSPNLALSADAISRFNREAANASRINHPNVAQIYDFGETADGLLYLAMEFVEGETLRSVIEREGALTAPRAARITKQTADALGAAHHLGMVHRDLKPDNVMLARHHDGSEWVKVVDFGIAKTVQGSGESGGSQTVTTAGVSLGTPEYMSPEQLAGERLDNRTDLYSLGLVLFNMLTADLPYPRVTSRETLVRRLTSKARTLSDVAPEGDWPPALQAALDKALAPEPADRYLTVADFGRDVLAATSEMIDPDRTVRLTPIRAPRLVPRTRPLEPRESPRARRGVFIAAGILTVLGALSAGAYVAVRSHSGASAKQLAAPAAPAAHMTTRVTAPAASLVTASDTDATRDTGHRATPPAFKPRDSALAPLTKPMQRAPAPRTEPAARGAIVTQSAKPDPTHTPVPKLTAPKHPAEDTMTALRNRLLEQYQHPWLRPNGEPARQRASLEEGSDAKRIRVIGGDIQGHMTRAEAFVRQGNIPKARSEYRDAVPVLKILRQLYAGTSSELDVERMVRNAAAQTLQSCFQAMSDSVVRNRMPPTFRCQNLLPPMMTGRGRDRFGDSGTP